MFDVLRPLQTGFQRGRASAQPHRGARGFPSGGTRGFPTGGARGFPWPTPSPARVRFPDEAVPTGVGGQLAVVRVCSSLVISDLEPSGVSFRNLWGRLPPTCFALETNKKTKGFFK